MCQSHINRLDRWTYKNINMQKHIKHVFTHKPTNMLQHTNIQICSNTQTYKHVSTHNYENMFCLLNDKCENLSQLKIIHKYKCYDYETHNCPCFYI